VIGTVQRDIYQDGKIVVPSGTVVACVVEQAVAFRDRIQVAGKWHLTYPDGKTGIEFEGVACDREADSDNRNFSPEDGSAGLLGNVIGGGDRFVRVPAGKEFYIVTTDAFVQGESIKKDAPATLNEILPLPLGCIIPCAFICGVDAQSHPPVSAVVITDVWWEGKMIIPKGAVVDALRQPVFVFDRMQLKGLWVIYGCETRVFR
jgi:hypothetical protein